MPPFPHPKESEQDFVNRCMSSKHANSKYPDEKQRAAVCYSIYKTAKKKKK